MFLRTCAATAAVLAGSLSADVSRFQGWAFESCVTPAKSRNPYREYREGSRTVLKVREGDEYSIVVKNPLPVRVAVAVSIDGLNSIDGKRTSPDAARKWIIEPNGALIVKGWQTSTTTLRNFVFTKRSDTYAGWKERLEGRRYTRNLGVIGVAWFWNSAELDRALHPPEPFADELSASPPASKAEAAGACRSAAPAVNRGDDRAGTGMGRQQRNDVTQVEFSYDTGMYANRDVLKIHYEFARPLAVPEPFEDGDELGFAPDMHR